MFADRLLRAVQRSLVKFLQADFDGPRELAFFFVEDTGDASGVLFEFGIRFLHLARTTADILERKCDGALKYATLTRARRMILRST